MYISRKHVEREVDDLLKMDQCKQKRALVEIIMSRLNLEKELSKMVRQEAKSRIALLDSRYAGKF